MGDPLNESEMRGLREEAQRYQREGPEPNQEKEFGKLHERIRELETMLQAARGANGARVNWPVISAGDEAVSTTPTLPPEIEFNGCENGVEAAFFIPARRGS